MSTPASPPLEGASKRQTALRGMMWMVAGGLALCTMNAVMRLMTLELHPMVAFFLRYVMGLVVMVPMLMRDGLAAYRPNNARGQVWRGAVHASALSLFFLALPHIPLADATAINFTTPIFVLIGAALLLGEKVSGARWIAALIGFSGVLIVLAPHLSGMGAGWWSLVMLASSPFFAGSFLINKHLTRFDSPSVIVFWQNVSVMLFALPLALVYWKNPSLIQWATFLLCGLLGTVAHLCMTRAFSMGDISAMQPVRFIDLIWASLLGLAIFGTSPSATALLGGVVIVASTIWIARRESGR
ncbi:MAG TPA: DMT family transporter [Burkholderiaceae bacterium]|nr:DMT family transporter [Burkholderiaceae bacterium]